MDIILGAVVIVGSCLVFKLVDHIIDLVYENHMAKLKKDWMDYGFLSKDDLHHLDPDDFEQWCADFLKRSGYSNVVVTSENYDGGKDIICIRDNEKIYVECKRYWDDSAAKYMVSRDIVQKLVGAMVGDGIHRGMIITTGIITGRSIEYVKSLPPEFEVELIDGDKLIKMYRELRQKEIDMNLLTSFQES